MELSLLERAIRSVGVRAVMESLNEDQREALRYEWRAWARPKQLPPSGDWTTWLLRAGRGFGKTRVGAEFVRAEVEAGRARRLALIAPTAADARDVMVEGESGILAVSPPWFTPEYEPSKRRLTWPNGAIGMLFSAEEPNRLRGPQHDLFWGDELASWKADQETWDMLLFGLRLGRRPRGVVTTTPRPTPLIRALGADTTTAVTIGSMYENASNLADSFLSNIRKKYEGTRLGRQEIHAEILDDNPGALWRMTGIEAKRVLRAPEFIRAGVGIDPAVSHEEGSAETGIIGAGIAACRCNGPEEIHAFVVEDRSDAMSPASWAAAAIGLYDQMHADRMVPEVNQGGDLVEANIRANGGRHVNVRPVHAARGKHTRAEPIAALYEQGRVHHVGRLGALEDQMTQWDPLNSPRSPDRMDALVHILTDLMLGAAPAQFSKTTRVLMPRRI